MISDGVARDAVVEVLRSDLSSPVLSRILLGEPANFNPTEFEKQVPLAQNPINETKPIGRSDVGNV